MSVSPLATDTSGFLVQSCLGQNPLSGNLFVFRTKRGNRIKLLYWNRDGYAICSKHLQRSTFRQAIAVDGNGVEIGAAALTMIPEGIDLRTVKRFKNLSKNCL